MDASENPLAAVTVIVCTKNRTREALATVSSILDQNVESLELIVVDQSIDDQRDAYLRLVQRRPRIATKVELRYYHCPRLSGLTAARNVGVDHASGDILVFLDDDVVLEDGFLAGLIKVLKENPQLGGVSGVQIQDESLPGWRVWFARLFQVGFFSDSRIAINKYHRKLGTKLIYTRKLSGGLTAYRREVFTRERFDEALIGYALGEDVEFSYRCSHHYKLGIYTGAKVYHKRSKTNRYDLLQRYEAKIVSAAYLYAKNAPKNPINRLAYLWYCVGLCLDALATAAVMRSWDPLRGLGRGWLMVRRGFAGVPFLQPCARKGASVGWAGK